MSQGYEQYIADKNNTSGAAFTAGMAKGTGAESVASHIANAIGGDAAKEMTTQTKETLDKTQAQHPIAGTAGYMGGKMGEYYVLGGLLKDAPVIGNVFEKAGNAASAALGGAGKAGATAAKFFTGDRVAGLLSDQLLDTAFDTVPEAVDNIQQGKSAGEVAKAAAKNAAVNAAFNLGSEAVPAAVKSIKGAVTGETAQAAKEAAAQADADVMKNFYAGDYAVKEAGQAPAQNPLPTLDNGVKNNYDALKGGVENGRIDTGTGFSGTEPGRAGGSAVLVSRGSRDAAGNQRVFRQSVSDPQVYARAGATTQKLADSTAYPDVFCNQLEKARQQNKNGLMVSAKTPQELADSGAITFMSEDGMSGAAVTADGDIEAVFRVPGGDGKRLSYQMIATAIDNGGTKLDCYGQELVKNYSKVGFEPVARVKWNPEYAPDGWTYGPKDVYVMKLQDGLDAATVQTKLGLSEADGGFHMFTNKELDALPEMEYDEAMKYRDSLISKPADAAKTADGLGAKTSEFAHKQKTSKVASNTFENTTFIDDVTKNIANLKADNPKMKYDVVSEKESLAKAAQRVQVDASGELADLSTKQSWSGEDTDTAMLLLDKASKEAKQTGDYSEVERLAKVIQKNGTQAGQNVQSFAKYTRTAAGTVVKAESAMAKAFDNIKATDPNRIAELEAVTKQLQDLANSYLS